MGSDHHLKVCLLGPPQVWVDGTPLDVLKLQKPLVLLVYLAVEAQRPHPRSALAALFWPDASGRTTRPNLRQLLYRLRRALHDAEVAPPHLLITSQALQFNAESDAWVDVVAFETLVNEVRQHRHRRLSACPTCIAKLEMAMTIYRGPFLSGLDLVGGVALEDWALLIREGLARQAHAALRALSGYHLAHDQQDLALQYARRLLRNAPWDEVAERFLLQALAASEGRNAALLEYRRFRQGLRAELGVEPEDETLALVAQIRSGAASAPAASSISSPDMLFTGREVEQAQT